MSIFSKIKELIGRVFGRNEIMQRYGTGTVLSGDTQIAIELWRDMYEGKAPWISKKKGVVSLRLEQGITREFANTAISEMTVSVSDQALSSTLMKALETLNENFQRGLATGAMIIKPLGENNVQYLSQDEFIPVAYDAAQMLTSVIFPEVKKVGDREYLIRLEFHVLDERGLTITNRAFRSPSPDSLGKEIELSSVPKWADIAEGVTYPGVTRPVYGYYVNPIDNTFDERRGGVSVFESAKQLIERADKQFGRLDWEFESGERAIHVDETALRPVRDKNGIRFEMPKLNERLYRGVNLSGGANGEDFFKEFSPTLRQADFVAGLEQYKREIEFVVGLAYGDLSNPQAVAKTATEVLVSKERKFNATAAIQKKLRVCLDGLVYALAFWGAKTTVNYNFVCDFEDSILVDDETRRNQDRQDVAIGAMQLWEYRMKWYHEDEETAKRMVSDTVDVVEE